MYMHIYICYIAIASYTVRILLNMYIGTHRSIAVQLQYDAVDMHMKLCRFKEEENQVINEMTSFLSYFRDNVLPQLYLSAKGEHMAKLVAFYYHHDNKLMTFWQTIRVYTYV